MSVLPGAWSISRKQRLKEPQQGRKLEVPYKSKIIDYIHRQRQCFTNQGNSGGAACKRGAARYHLRIDLFVGATLRKTLALIALLGLSSCAVASLPPPDPAPYAGKDAGYLVMAFGQKTGTDYVDYSLKYMNAVGGGGGSITYYPYYPASNQRPADFKNSTGSGDIETVAMQPGTYDLYNFEMSVFYEVGLETFKVRDDFFIPFTIRAGEATYLGQYMTSGTTDGKDILSGTPIPAGAILLVSDQKDFDVSVAHTPALKIPGLPGNVTVVNDATPDPVALGIPFLKTDPNPGGLERESIPAVEP